MIRGCNLDCRRQIEDNLLIVGSPRSSPSRLHRLTHRQRELGFRLSESLRTILIPELRPVLCRTLVRKLSNDFGVFDGKGDSFFLAISENDVSETWAGSVVHVDNGLLGSCDRFHCTLDQVFSSWCEDLSHSINIAHEFIKLGMWRNEV